MRFTIEPRTATCARRCADRETARRDARVPAWRCSAACQQHECSKSPDGGPPLAPGVQARGLRPRPATSSELVTGGLPGRAGGRHRGAARGARVHRDGGAAAEHQRARVPRRGGGAALAEQRDRAGAPLPLHAHRDRRRARRAGHLRAVGRRGSDLLRPRPRSARGCWTTSTAASTSSRGARRTTAGSCARIRRRAKPSCSPSTSRVFGRPPRLNDAPGVV